MAIDQRLDRFIKDAANAISNFACRYDDCDLELLRPDHRSEAGNGEVGVVVCVFAQPSGELAIYSWLCHCSFGGGNVGRLLVCDSGVRGKVEALGRCMKHKECC